MTAEDLCSMSAEKKRRNGKQNTVGTIQTYALADGLLLYILVSANYFCILSLANDPK